MQRLEANTQRLSPKGQHVPLHPSLPLTRRMATRKHRRPFPSHLQRGVPVTRPTPSRSRQPLPLGRKSPAPPSIDQPGSIPKATHRPSAELTEFLAHSVSKLVPVTKASGSHSPQSTSGGSLINSKNATAGSMCGSSRLTKVVVSSAVYHTFAFLK